MLENDEKGIKPLYRTRKEMLSDRGSKKDPSHQWWKKSDSKDSYTAVMYVPQMNTHENVKCQRKNIEFK